MDNFEYSIQLNDRDWAEFYLASEECNLIQPTLATADKQLLSDLEEGEVEEGRLIGGRVGPALAHSSACRLPHAAPDGHLLAEEVWSGSEDETDLGSVHRFFYKNSLLGTAPSSGIQEQGLSCEALKPPGRQSGSATESDTLRATEERASDMGDPPTSHSVVAAAVQKEDFQGRNPKQETPERLAGALQTNLGASERMDNPAGENGSSSLCLAQQPPKDDASQRASVDQQRPTWLENTAVGGSPESLEQRDQAGQQRPAHSPSPGSTEHQGAELLEKGTRTHQATLRAQSVPCQEALPASHGHSVPAVRTLMPTDPPPENHVEGSQGRSRKAEQVLANLRGEGRAGPSEAFSCGLLKDAPLMSQVVSPNREVVGAEDNTPTPAMDDSRCSKALDKHRDSASLARGQEEGKSGEPSCHRLGTAVPLEEESPVLAPGSRRADVFRASVHCGPAWENSPESDVTVVTWPEMYDCFFGSDSQEQGGQMRERAGKERLGSGTEPSLPEVYGPEMYEYFFNEVGEARGGNRAKGTKLGRNSGSGQRPAPGSDSEDPDSDPAVHISIPEVYDHFFVSRTKDKRTWSAFFLSLPALEAKKVARALKSLVCKPVRPLGPRPTRQGALLRRGSQGRLVLLSRPGLLEDHQPRAGDPTMAVMVPGTAFPCYVGGFGVFIAFNSGHFKISCLGFMCG